MSIEALNNSLTGLKTHQTALGVIANNIANANTEGYVRKVAQLESIVLNGRGSGVRIADIQRQIDENLMAERRRRLGELSRAQVIDDYQFQIQNLFGAPADNSTIAQQITELSNAFEALANFPEDTSKSQGVVRTAEVLTEQLSFHYQRLQQLRAQADQQIEETVDEINGLLDEIDTLNVKIVASSHRQLETGELRDHRDVALNRLAELIDIVSFERSAGDVVISTTGGKLLLDVDPAEIQFTAANDLVSGIDFDPERVTPPGDEGVLSGILVNDFDRQDDITRELRRGELAGLVELRDQIIPSLQTELDNLAQNLRDGLNAVHNLGASFPPPNELTGTRQFLNEIPFANDLSTPLTNGVDDLNNGLLGVSTSASAVMYGGVGVSRFSVVTSNPASSRGELVETVTIDWDQLRLDLGGTLSLQDVIDEINGSLTNADAFFTNGRLEIQTTDPNNGVVVEAPANMIRTGEALVGVDIATTTALSGASSFNILDANGDIIASINLTGTETYTDVVQLVNDVAGVTARLQQDFQGGASTTAAATERVDITADDGTQLSFVDTGTTAYAAGLGLTDTNGATLTGLRDTATVPVSISRNFARSDIPVGRMDGEDTVSEPYSFSIDVDNGAGAVTTVTATFDPTVDSLRDIVADLNDLLVANALDGFAEARLVERDGFRIELNNSTGANVQVNRSFSTTDGAELLGFVDETAVSIDEETRGFSHYFGLNDFFVDNGSFSTTETIEVNSKLIENTQFVSHARLENSLNTDNIPPVTVEAIFSGDNTGATLITQFFQGDTTFDAAGELPELSMKISEYAARIISNNSLNADITADEVDFQQNVVDELNLQIESISGVNLDEELSNMILFQNAFTASARVVTTTQQMLDELVDLVR